MRNNAIKNVATKKLVGTSGFEPPTPTMSRWCSNQLSYVPATKGAQCSSEPRNLQGKFPFFSNLFAF